MKKLFTGNEAVARGVYEAGVKFAAAYPGTPSTEIIENIALYKDDIVAEIATNEKVALEAAIGGSFAGARSFAAMKHVGINVAADPMFTFAYTGVNGGMVLVSADEPGMYSSQNEQDNRNYARHAFMPMFEPSDSQECKDMIVKAYEVSEQFDAPVLFRMTTRVCHSKSIVEIADRNEVGIKPYTKNIVKNVPVPKFSKIMKVKVLERTEKLRKFSNETELNYMEMYDTKIGVVASGGCYTYAKEVFGENASYMKIGFSWPMPMEKIKEFASKVDKIYVIEENDPIMETEMKANGIECEGKDMFPSMGELTPDVIRKSVNGETMEPVKIPEDKVVGRPPSLCAGCPHRGFFLELSKRKDCVMAGDIGCYGLGFDEPYNAVDFSICMGAGFSVGYGAQKVFNMNENSNKRVVGMMGDSTFFHTGINSLINTVYNKTNVISVILDNRITGMTGHQENPGSGYTLQGMPTEMIEIEPLVRAIGIKHVKVVDPNQLNAMKEAFDWAWEIDEPTVIITRWPCVLKKLSPEDKDEFKGAFTEKCVVDHDKCIGCKKCIKTGCPALSFDKKTKKATINRTDCVACTVCVQSCPVNAIAKEEK